MIKDNGNRRDFESGAVRDIAEGKAVRILDNWAPNTRHGIHGALREADTSDKIEKNC